MCYNLYPLNLCFSIDRIKQMKSVVKEEVLMNKKGIIIIAAVIVAATAVTFASIRINREKDREAAEEAEFLPGEWAPEADNLENEKLVLYFLTEENNAAEDVLQALNRRLKDDIKTEVAFEFIYNYPEVFIQEVRQTIAAGSPCDAFYFSDYFPMSLKSLADEGLAKDLTDLFPQYAYDYYGQFSEEDRNALLVNGKLYCIPARIPSAYKKCAIVRTDLMEKYNIQDIGSFDDYEVYLHAIKENEPEMIPMNYYDLSIGLFSDVEGYVVLDYDLGLVYKWDSPSIIVEAWEQTSGFSTGLNRINGWFQKGYLLKDVFVSQIDERMVSSGKWASFIGNWGDQFTYNSIIRANGTRDWSYEAYPLHDGFSVRNSPMESGLVVSNKSEFADRVLMFVNWLQSDQQNYDLLMYGIKGTHYIEKGDYIEPPEGTEMDDSFFNWGWKAPFRNIDFERANFPGLKEDVRQYYDVITKSTKYAPHIGFYPDYSTINEIATLRRIDNHSLDTNAYSNNFKPIDAQEYIKRQKDQGIDVMIEEVQRQLDGYINNRD